MHLPYDVPSAAAPRNAVLYDASQHHLAHHPGRRDPLVLGKVVAGGDGDGEVEPRQHEQPLAAFAVRDPGALDVGYNEAAHKTTIEAVKQFLGSRFKLVGN
jgi:hypothetical protein